MEVMLEKRDTFKILSTLKRKGHFMEGLTLGKRLLIKGLLVGSMKWYLVKTLVVLNLEVFAKKMLMEMIRKL